MRDDATVAANSATCVWCGTQVEELPLTWTVQTGERGAEYLCEKCTRDNARQIESSLPTEWW
jgi:DNA-directed RNA polymerase subunit RPC12/RpoP